LGIARIQDVMWRRLGIFPFRKCVRITVGFARPVSLHPRAAVADLPPGFSRGFGRPLTSPNFTSYDSVADSSARGSPSL
jgi:hypothetical protein